MHTIAQLVATFEPETEDGMPKSRNEETEKRELCIAIATDRIIRGKSLVECMCKYRINSRVTVWRHVQTALTYNDPMCAILRRVVADKTPKSLAS